MSTAELTEELRLVEEDLAQLRETAAVLRRRTGTAAPPRQPRTTHRS
jgi:hypothetical protein